MFFFGTLKKAKEGGKIYEMNLIISNFVNSLHGPKFTPINDRYLYFTLVNSHINNKYMQ